ncbi:tyrosine-type recombinase/integrase [Streptomyces antibioticus]|uniref:tyrosine-type recombinase/integrase n=1 Tax=Streptomyces antibioticus TaxID=1890 RepID=UPI0036BB3964
MDSRFAAYRDAVGLDPALEFHSLRRSYITHLIEDGQDPLFVQQQVGHDHASTTAIH